MKYTYEVIEVNGLEVIMRSDGATIPADESNSDYQAYLAAQETINAN